MPWRLGTLGLALLGLIGCTPWATRETGPGIDSWEYRHSCGACHKLPQPKSKSDEEWQQYVLEHRLVAGQDEETAQLYADYLKRVN